MIFLRIFLILISFSISAREVGQTEITTSGGIEVFKLDKYYLLKEDVKINSDNFKLEADLVKAFFNEDLYDIIKIDSSGNAIFESNRGLKGKGDIVKIDIKSEYIFIQGENSSLLNQNILMNSDETIEVNNLSGEFKLKGLNSRLTSEDIDITGFIIEGVFENINGANEVQELYVEDNSQLNIQTETLNMFSLKAKYIKKDNIIELFDNVKVFRNNELITGDYAKINTLTESYKVTSKDSQKVKVLLNESNE